MVNNYGWKYSFISFYILLHTLSASTGCRSDYITMGTMYLNKLTTSYVESIGSAKLDFYGFNQMARIFMALLLGLFFCFKLGMHQMHAGMPDFLRW